MLLLPLVALPLVPVLLPVVDRSERFSSPLFWHYSAVA